MVRNSSIHRDLRIDRSHSSVQLAVSHIVSTFRASFDGIEARLALDGGEATLVARARAESVSIVEPPELREHAVNSDDFFAAHEHPQLTFAERRAS